MNHDEQNQKPDMPLVAPTPTVSIPITIEEYYQAGSDADDTLYRIITVSVNPLTEYEHEEMAENIHELKPVFPSDSPAAYQNTYEMALWEIGRCLVPWIMRQSGGLREQIVHVQRLGRFKGHAPEIEGR
jgi:hypothetical protein